jgi:hypothetical protein
MGFFQTEYLRKLGGLEDVSEDGFGLYCEYMILVRLALLERLVYIDAPMVFYRVHPGAWGISNSDLDQYDRAGENLIKGSAPILLLPESKSHFSLNLRQLLKRVLGQYVNVARRAETFHLHNLVAYFIHARKYVKPFKGTGYYLGGLRALVGAEVWLLWALCKQKFLAVAPNSLIKLAYSSRSALHRGKLSNPAATQNPV